MGRLAQGVRRMARQCALRTGATAGTIFCRVEAVIYVTSSNALALTGAAQQARVVQPTTVLNAKSQLL